MNRGSLIHKNISRTTNILIPSRNCFWIERNIRKQLRQLLKNGIVHEITLRIPGKKKTNLFTSTKKKYCTIDRLELRNGELRIIDFKTHSKQPLKPTAQHIKQITLYKDLIKWYLQNDTIWYILPIKQLVWCTIHLNQSSTGVKLQGIEYGHGFCENPRKMSSI